MGTIVGASITAGIGGWLGGRRSRKDQQAQHEHEREVALTQQGREKAHDAIYALRFLKRHRRIVIKWTNVVPEGDLDPAREQHERLGQAIEYLHDEFVRQQVALIYDVLDSAYLVTRYGPAMSTGPDFADAPEALVWGACNEGIKILGQYLRGGSTPRPSPYMTELQTVYDDTFEMLDQDYEDWKESQPEPD